VAYFDYATAVYILGADLINVKSPLVYHGENLSDLPAGQTKFAQCEGSCSTDHDCMSGLKCDDSADIPPDCAGEAGDATTNYCYDPDYRKFTAISLQTNELDTFEVFGCNGRAWVEEKDKDSNGGVFDFPRWSFTDTWEFTW